jgi:hypothetical protein
MTLPRETSMTKQANPVMTNRLRTVSLALLMMVMSVIAACSNDSDLGLDNAPSTSDTLGTDTVSSSASGVTTPTGWVRFQGESISLALPASFHENATQTYNAVGDLMFWWSRLAQYSSLHFPDYEFPFIWGQPTADGYLPVVTGAREPCGGRTFQEYVQAGVSLLNMGGASVEIEDMNEDRAYLVTRMTEPPAQCEILGAPDSLGVEVSYWVVVRTGSYYYYVVYKTSSESFDAFLPIFKASAATISTSE